MEKLTFVSNRQDKVSILALEMTKIKYNAFQKSLRKKDVKVNGKRISTDLIIGVNDIVEIFTDNITEILPYTIIFEDENIIVLNKKSGITSEEVFKKLQVEKGEVYFIHRLDRNTAGIMIFAKLKMAEKELLLGFKNRTFDKIYKAKVYGHFEIKSDTLTAYLLKDSEKSIVQVFDKQVKNSVLIKTGYKVIEEGDNFSTLLVVLYTGKTHQIRAHLSHIGHFILGDGKYGDNKINKQFGYKTQQLSAVKLTLNFDKTSPLFYLNKKTFSIL